MKIEADNADELIAQLRYTFPLATERQIMRLAASVLRIVHDAQELGMEGAHVSFLAPDSLGSA